MTNPNYIEQEWQSLIRHCKSVQTLSADSLKISQTLFYLGAAAVLHAFNDKDFDRSKGDFIIDELRQFLCEDKLIGEVPQ
ncbi:hypothetical protein ACMYR3_06045 [Ampullimonas aquatilis]|uniref:hypothetical protein n=1 Tax=Ampullimonas aquatilis TaxID=1341549 RepID=UPI003C72C191